MSNFQGTLYNTSALKRKEPPTSISSPSKRQKLSIRSHSYSPSCLLSPLPFILPLNPLLSSHSSPSSPLKPFSISPSLSPPPSPTLSPFYSPFSSPLHSPLLSSSPLLLPLSCSRSSSPPSPLLSFSSPPSTLSSSLSSSSFSSTTTPTKNKRYFDKVFSSSTSSTNTTTTIASLPVLSSTCTIEKRKIIESIAGREFLKKLDKQQIEMLESLVEKVSSEVVDDDATDIEDDDDFTTLPILLNSVVNTGIGRKNGNTSHDIKLFKYIREAIEYQDDYKDNNDNCTISTSTSTSVSTFKSTFTPPKIYKKVEFVLPEEEEEKKRARKQKLNENE